MVKRCKEKGFSMEEIKDVTKKSEEEIESALASAMSPGGCNAAETEKAEQERKRALEQTIYKLELEYVLRFILPTRQVQAQGAVVKLALVGEKQRVLGETSVRLADVLLRKDDREVEFKSHDGRKINAEVKVSVLGLS